MSDADNYQAAMLEIGEIVRVARDNSRGLKAFLMANYPKEWGLTKQQHANVLKGHYGTGRGWTTPRHSYSEEKPYSCINSVYPWPHGDGGKKSRLRPCPINDSTDEK